MASNRLQGNEFNCRFSSFYGKLLVARHYIQKPPAFLIWMANGFKATNSKPGYPLCMESNWLLGENFKGRLFSLYDW